MDSVAYILHRCAKFVHWAFIQITLSSNKEALQQNHQNELCPYGVRPIFEVWGRECRQFQKNRVGLYHCRQKSLYRLYMYSTRVHRNSYRARNGPKRKIWFGTDLLSALVEHVCRHGLRYSQRTGTQGPLVILLLQSGIHHGLILFWLHADLSAILTACSTAAAATATPAVINAQSSQQYFPAVVLLAFNSSKSAAHIYTRDTPLCYYVAARASTNLINSQSRLKMHFYIG